MKLSIIIAAYNVEKQIEKCILSCVQQDIKPDEFEIVVVNDGSIDKSLTIIENLSQNYSNIVVVKRENGGLGAARNSGLRIAKGEYIWFIDGDDYIDKDCLGIIVKEIYQKQLDVLVLNYSVATEDGQLTRIDCNPVILSKEIISGGEFFKTNFNNSYTWLYVFKKSLFTENNIFFKERINMQDSEILPRLLYHTSRLSYLDRINYYYVQVNTSFTNSSNGEKRYFYFQSIIEVRNSLSNFLGDISDTNPDLTEGVKRKLKSLHHTVFNHLVFFKYEKEWLLKIIQLLSENDFYPLRHKAKGIMKIIKCGLNHYPVFTKKYIDKIQQLRRK